MPTADEDKLLTEVNFRDVGKNTTISQQDLADGSEYFLLDGRCRNVIRDAEGREATVALFDGIEVITPHAARTSNGKSLVDIEFLSEGLIAEIPAQRFFELMVGNEAIRNWGNHVMQQELQHKVSREWCLAALPAAERLLWFRDVAPLAEDLFPHTYIASFLGMTPVTLSRIRQILKQKGLG